MASSKSKKTVSRQKGKYEEFKQKYAKAYEEVFNSLPAWKKRAVLEDSAKNINLSEEKFSILALFVKEVIKKAEEDK